MKAKVHPQWFDTTVICACGETFTVGSTVPEIHVEVCSVCHPFYTGQMKLLDTAGRVDAFKNRMDKKNVKRVSKTEKRQLKRAKKLDEERERPDTLADLRK